MPLVVVSRQDFLTRKWVCRPGEHVTIIGPTGCGKSTLAYQLIDAIATPEHPVVSLLKKPRDPVIIAAAKRMGLRKIDNWPPPGALWHPRKPRGWLLHPRTVFRPEIDRPRKMVIFRRALLDGYRRGGRILYVDDAYGISETLDLREDLIELWTELRSMDGELWTSFQKPSHVPLWAYSQAEHIFLFHDPDKRARERFAEIGGIDPDMIKAMVMQLARHQCLYIKRDGPRACIIDK